MQALSTLEVTNDLEEIAGLRIAGWTEHPHEALRRPFRTAAQLLEPDRRVDVVAKDRLARIEISGEEGFDAFSEQFLPVFPVRLGCVPAPSP